MTFLIKQLKLLNFNSLFFLLFYNECAYILPLTFPSPSSFFLQRAESACFECDEQTSFHYRSEPWLCPGKHPSCRLEATFYKCQRPNQWGKLGMRNAGLLMLLHRYLSPVYVSSLGGVWGTTLFIGVHSPLLFQK